MPNDPSSSVAFYLFLLLDVPTFLPFLYLGKTMAELRELFLF